MSTAYELDRQHVFHSWSAQAEISPMVISAARGSYVWDDEDRRYLDFSSQLVFTNIGHQHPRVVAAIQEQAGRLCTVAPQFANAERSRAAELIAGLAPDGFEKVFFTNGGADANEHAIRMARLHTGRHKVLSAYRSYHGGTETAINVTGDPRRWPNDTATSGTVHFFGPFLYRSEFHSTSEEEESERALAHLRRTIEAEGPATIAAIILESIPGTAGIFAPPPGYLAGVRALCDEHGIVMVLDEVMAGFGRAGAWFALDLFGVVPDLITFAKGVNSGYVPLGGVVISDRIAATFDHRPYPGGLTYSGHPLACAAAVATIETMRDEGIVENAARLGRDVLGPGLAELAERHPCVGDVRGVGAFWALDLVTDPGSKAMLSPAQLADVVSAAKGSGLLPFANTNRIHVVPPCTMSDDEAREGLAILDEALKAGDAHVA
ncbi:aspartate aminotransferase family protein [Nocardioides flavescens]|uniref:Aminotransferase class III-fold pyridoxal phosphate-dependent enzyme n=1 Tax=Nocardioides flavescens TaxID=2691959 RepID=A0A6L7EZG2_9ACTN|nr:aspartate aminotransferase family protein [Nocardioides flavescens]MXG89032.1 aminotransferase class III-fold pyridoxal phosphate-dependent enzyme [Nocardioides flavescens]